MDEQKILILLKGKDRTKEIEQITYQDERVEIKFKNEKVYSYGKENVIKKETAEPVSYENQDLFFQNQRLLNVKKVIRFEEYLKIFFQNDATDFFFYDEIEFRTCSKTSEVSIMEYFQEIATYVKSEEKEKPKYQSEETFLEREFRKINYILSESVLSYYLQKKPLEKKSSSFPSLIFPFGFNLSQKKAVENIYQSNVSIIEGPPGTGKTQTILNIIANLVMQGKTIAVVSNNNEAVKNVKEKLGKAGYAFLCAHLGKDDYRKMFFENLMKPQIEEFHLVKNLQDLYNELDNLNDQLNKLLEKNNRKSELERDIEKLKLEKKYFLQFYEQQNREQQILNQLTFQNEEQLFECLFDCQLLLNQKVFFPFFQKLKLSFKYGMKKIDSSLFSTILYLKKNYYELKLAQLEQEYDNLKNVLETQKFENLQKKHVTLSNEIFQAFLYEKYQGKTNDFEYFSYKQHIYEFIDSFPVILSTTYSLRNCIPKNFLFDYVIIDESSQVDLLAGSLALSAAKNAVIVGDTKQLPQIVDKKIKKELSYSNVEICYDYFKQNLLSSFFSLYPDILSVTLKEHYRCYSKIIEFCNQRYYDGQLIPFFDEKNHQNIKKPLIIYHCAPGNHMKQKKLKNKCDNYNEREMEVIKEEVLKSGIVEEYQDEDIGITTPYRFQADEISKALEEAVESDTIHKFQGREKKLMILSTVIDSSYYGKKNIHFVDDPCMLNVAVSRAIRQFVLVTDHDLFKKMGTEVKALLKYMKYHTMDSEIIESNLISVFDLLYQNYHDSLNDLSKRLLNRYRYKSENIMDAILTKELQKEEYKDYSYTGQIFLKEIFRENDKFIEEERNFIRNNSSFDFVVYHVLDKQPVLFIEVDGFYYHKNNKNQQRRDRLKDSIAKKCKIPLLRFETQKYYKEENIIAAVRNILLKE